jgi:hypothetical protein
MGLYDSPWIMICHRPLTQVAPGLRVLHDRQAPLLELVHRGIHVARHVEQQVLAHEAHEVDARVAHVVLGIVLAPARAHVAVDRVQALGHRAGAIDVRLLGDHDLLVLAPEPRLPGGAGAAQPRTDDQDVDAVFDDRLVGHQ